MKRHLLTILLFLLLGAVVNVAVAWACGYLIISAPQDYKFGAAATAFDGLGNASEVWTTLTHRGLGTLIAASTRRRRDVRNFTPNGVDPATVLPYWADIAAPSPGYITETIEHDRRWAVARGWPLVALCDYTHEVNRPTRFVCTGGIDLGWGRPIGNRGRIALRQLPLIPIWPGFAINTVFYAAILWLPICGPFVLRRRIRHRRGRCVNCGYDLRRPRKWLPGMWVESGGGEGIKRHLLTILLFLLLGAVVNVLVAWGLWFTPEPPWVFLDLSDFDSGVAPESASLWLHHRPPGFEPYPIEEYSGHSAGVGWVDMVAFDGGTKTGDLEIGSFRLTGWPMESLYGYRFTRRFDMGSLPDVDAVCFLRVRRPGSDSDWDDELWLSYLPIWPGFAINTLFYAALLWLLLRGPFVLRRQIRRRRGRCVKCGYDLRGDLERGCSECGWNREGVTL